MKKYSLTILIIFAVLFNFKEVKRNVTNAADTNPKTCLMSDQNSEEDCAVLNIAPELQSILILQLIEIEFKSPLNIVLNIWKPPVNA